MLGRSIFNFKKLLVATRMLPALAALCLLTGCASIYLHDDGLALATATADKQIKEAKLDAPFDSAESKLATTQQQEELAIAEFMVASRNQIVGSYLVGRPPDEIENAVTSLVAARLAELSPNGSLQVAAVSAHQNEIVGLKEDVARYQGRYIVYVAEAGYADKAPTCVVANADYAGKVDPTAEDKALAERQRQAAKVATQVATTRSYAWAKIYVACADIARLEKKIEEVWRSGGILREVSDQVAAAEKKVKSRASAEAEGKTALDQAIKEVEALEKENPGSDFTREIADIVGKLNNLDEVVRVFAWDHFDSELGRIINGLVCGSRDEADKDAKAEAGCPAEDGNDADGAEATSGKIAPGGDAKSAEANSATGANAVDVKKSDPPAVPEAGELDDVGEKTKAIIDFAYAIADVSTAQKRDGRTGQWLVAARAIAQARGADAKIGAARDATVLKSLRAKLVALRLEASILTCARIALSPEKSCRGETGADFAVASYILAWNTGRTPAVILEARAAYAERYAALRRVRSAAERQQALISAATGQLKSYGEGGFTPDLIAQILLAFGLVAAVEN